MASIDVGDKDEALIRLGLIDSLVQSYGIGMTQEMEWFQSLIKQLEGIAVCVNCSENITYRTVRSRSSQNAWYHEGDWRACKYGINKTATPKVD